MDEKELDVSVVMPCLNEAASVAICVDKVHQAFEGTDISYEVVIGDNGSTDGSQQLARDHGARVVDVTERGYGNALRGAIEAAHGRNIVMGDADDTYDFLGIVPFVRKLDEGHDLVMGSRFKGKIYPGAMPPLHRYLGNPVLTGILNLLFSAGISDAHCGLRAFRKQAYRQMALKTGGMEFASEMVIRAAQERLRITEVPTTLKPDRRDRPPHLRSFRDGWRHLRFMLMFSPSWLFILPGLLFLLPGVALVTLLPFVDITLFGHRFSIHFSILGALLTVVGLGVLQIGVFAKVVFVGKGLGNDRIGRRFLDTFHLETFLIIGTLLGLIGFCGNGWMLYSWLSSGLSGLDATQTNVSLLSTTAIMVGTQLLFAAFFLGILRASFTGVWVD